MKRFVLGLLLSLIFLSPAFAAARFLVCVTTCTITSSDTTIWSASSGGATGASVPGSSDTVTLDAATCVGGVTCTATLNFGGTWTIQSLTMGTCTASTTGCIFDNSVNNNNITLTLAGSAFSGTGSGVRNFKLGTATYTLSGSSTATWTFANVTNLTMTASNATVAFSSAGGIKNFFGGTSQTYGTVTFAGATGAGRAVFSTAFTANTLTLTAPNFLVLDHLTIPVVGTTLNMVGTASSPIGVISDQIGTQASMSVPASQTAQWTSFRDVAITSNTLTAINSANLGDNSGVTITTPQALGSGGGTLIGG